MVATKGRKVVVRDDRGDRDCFLSGHRVVIGDRVDWVDVRGDGGKVVTVHPRVRVLERRDFKGRDQVIAAHLGGIAVLASVQQPPYRPGLVDRYLVAASIVGVDAVLIVTKSDLGVPPEVDEDLAEREALGLPVLRCEPTTGEGVAAVSAWLQAAGAPGPWVFLGHSGVGKTSLVQALLPDLDAGPVGEVSAYWDQGKHTTTSSRIYALGDAEVADSPGIRTFLPAGLEPGDVRDHFPGLGPVACRYRDCLHREGEAGCAAEADVEQRVLARYRRLLDDVVHTGDRART